MKKLGLIAIALLGAVSAQAEVFGVGMRPSEVRLEAAENSSGNPVAQSTIDVETWRQSLSVKEADNISMQHRLLQKALIGQTTVFGYQMQPYLTLDKMGDTLQKYEADAPLVGRMDAAQKQIVQENRRTSAKMREAQAKVAALLHTDEQKSRFTISGFAWAEYIHGDCALTAAIYSNDYYRCLNLHYTQRAEALESTARRLHKTQ